MDLHLTDKVALITGSSRGLGLASAMSLAAEGCKVMLTARGADGLSRAIDDVRGVARTADAVAGVAGDLATLEGVTRAVERTIEQFGALDILVNNMGRAAPASPTRATRSGRRRLRRRSIRRFMPHGSRCRICAARAAA